MNNLAPASRQPGHAGSGVVTSAVKAIFSRVSLRHYAILAMWIVGMYVALYATPPETTPEAQSKFTEILEEASVLHHEKIYEALMVAQDAQRHTDEAKVWFWYFRGEETTSEVYKRQAAADELFSQVALLRGEHAALISKAKSEVGLWSEYGVAEIREMFWGKVEGGKDFAKRATFWDMLFSRTSRDEGVLGMILSWIIRLMFNFTLGMIGAFIGFWMNLWSVLTSYQPDPITAFLFYSLALLAAGSVVMGYLAGMVTVVGGVAIGGSYAFTAALESQREQERHRINSQRQQWGSAPRHHHTE